MKKIFLQILFVIFAINLTGCGEDNLTNDQIGVKITVSNIVSERVERGETIDFPTSFDMNIFMGSLVNQIMITEAIITLGNGTIIHYPLNYKIENSKFSEGVSTVETESVSEILIPGFDLPSSERWIQIEIVATALNGNEIETIPTIANIGWEVEEEVVE
jgi:hypothetical protein